MRGLPNGWGEARLEDVCEILDFKRIPINSKERKQRIEGKNPQELFPYYGATGQVDMIDGYLFEGEHVLVGEDGAPFLDPIKPKAYIVDGKFWVNNHAHILRSLGSNRFLCHYLNFIRYEDHVTGTTRLKLTKSALTAIPILVPPLNEQRRIVDKVETLFDEIDKGVESLQTAKTTLGLYRQSLLKSAFEGRLTADWRKKNTDKLEGPEALLARIQAERESRFKAALDDWQEAFDTWRSGSEKGKKPTKPKRPREIAPKATGIDIPGWAVLPLGLLIDEPTYGTSKKSDYDNGEKGVLRIPNIAAGIIDSADLKLADFDKAELEQYRLIEGDVLTIRSNGSLSLVGKPALVRAIDTQFVYAGYLIRLRPIPALLVSKCLIYLMKEASVRVQIENKAKSTSGVNNINAKELQELQVAICSPNEQAEIVRLLDEKLDAADALEAEIDAGRTRASALRQSILKKAFSGQLVPQDPSDEPASELLARIQVEKAADQGGSNPNSERRRNAGQKAFA